MKARYLAKMDERKVPRTAPTKTRDFCALSFLFWLSDSVLQSGHGCLNRVLIADPYRGTLGNADEVRVTLYSGSSRHSLLTRQSSSAAFCQVTEFGGSWSMIRHRAICKKDRRA